MLHSHVEFEHSGLCGRTWKRFICYQLTSYPESNWEGRFVDEGSHWNLSLWVTGPRVEFWPFPFISLRWTWPFSQPPASNFTSTTVSALKELQSFAWFLKSALQVLKHSSHQTNLSKNCLGSRSGQFVCCQHVSGSLIKQAISIVDVLCKHICWPLSSPHLPPLSLIKPRCANTEVYLGLINDNR